MRGRFSLRSAVCPGIMAGVIFGWIFTCIAADDSIGAVPQPAVPSIASTENAPSDLRLYMPDGQLITHIIRVYVNHDITAQQDPRLVLFRSHAITNKSADEEERIKPALVAPGQVWEAPLLGQTVQHRGTLLLFDLSQLKTMGYKAMLRVMPVVQWKEGASQRFAVGAAEVNMGNIIPASCYTVLVVVVALAAIFVLAWRQQGGAALLLAGVDGHLSLAKAQIACWTTIIGGVVLGYGVIRLAIPEIPVSLLVLMGASLTTGGLGFFKDRQNERQAAAAGVVPTRHAPAIGDLIRNFPPGKPPELSLAKAQMLFWTVLLIVLFVSKSILDGAIWEVPWALVALMGFSQTGYLAPKLVTAG